MDGLAIYNGFLSGYINISQHKEYLNRINVFPVPDGDTGNNMIRTFKSIVTGLSPSRSAAKVLDRIAYLSLEGARGNSGTILSQFLNGLAITASEQDTFSLREFGEVARESVSFAYQAMDSPEEGTILTVIRAWAETIYTESLNAITMNELFSRGLKAARNALEKTPEQLQVLKDNGVVDAGAWGFVSFLEGFEDLQNKGPVPLSVRKHLDNVEPPVSGLHVQSRHSHKSGDLVYRYCTEILLDNVSASTDQVKKSLRSMGDSLIVAQGRNRIRVHIHTNSPADVVQKSRRFGSVAQQKVDDMFRQEQVVENRLGKIAVLTDSIADIPQDILDKYQIHVLNLNLTWGEEEFLDRLTITPEVFYRQQLIRRGFPGSSVPDNARVDNLFQTLLDSYDGVIVLPVAKSLSGTWQQMSLAADKYNKESERIHIIDTCLNSAAQGLLVVEIAKEAAGGAELESLVLLADSLKKRIRIYVSVSTFKYMVRGGRVSPLKGLAATLMNLKPIVSLDGNGKGVAFDKAFSRKGLLKKISRIILNTENGSGIDRYVIVHASAIDEAEQFSNIVKEITNMEPDYITEISPIVGMHSGRGAVAIGLIESIA